MEPILQVINVLKQNPKLRAANTVLDLGCGSFYNKSIELFEERDILNTVFNGKDITGVDIFKQDVMWRKEHGPPGKYIHMDILDFNIENYYDVIICHHVLEHLTQENHNILFDRIDNANCKNIILGGPIGYSDNSVFVEIKGNKHEEHKIGLDPKFYREYGYEIYLFGPSFLAVKEK